MAKRTSDFGAATVSRQRRDERQNLPSAGGHGGAAKRSAEPIPRQAYVMKRPAKAVTGPAAPQLTG